MLFISQDGVDVARVPLVLARSVFNAVRFQLAGNFEHTCTLKIFAVDALHDFSFLGNAQKAVYALQFAVQCE